MIVTIRKINSNNKIQHQSVQAGLAIGNFLPLLSHTINTKDFTLLTTIFPIQVRL